MSAIEWTDETWNPVIGCTPVSPGCLNCYAATMANRLQNMRQATDYAPRLGGDGQGKNGQPIRIAEVKSGRAVFTGDVRCLPHKLDEPLHWRTPRRVFVNSMSDLFHESVPFEFIAAVYGIMAATPRHTMQVLTKRPERAVEFYRWMEDASVGGAVTPQRKMVLSVHQAMGGRAPGGAIVDGSLWPLPNVWLGASVERQQEADERIPHLLRCPAELRFLSCEPLLSEVNLRFEHEYLTDMMDLDHNRPQCRRGTYPLPSAPFDARTRRKHVVDWVIVGGESGPRSRPCDVAWIRSIVKQCQDAGVPCFVKQLGARVFVRNDTFSEWPRDGDGLEYDPSGPGFHYQGESVEVHTNDPKGGDPSEWPADLRVRQFPEVSE